MAFPTTNLVSFWKLDETSGNANDSYGTNTLTNNNTVTYTTGKINNGASFTRASSKSLSRADNASLSITGNLSISMWVNFATTPTSGNHFGLVAKLEGSPNYSYALTLHHNGTGLELYFQNSTNGTAVTQKFVDWTPTTSTWYHVMAIYTAAAGSVAFYVNGSQQGSTQSGLGTSIYDSTSTFYIGRYDGGNYMDGLIDEVGIWNTALTGTDVTTLYNGGAGLSYGTVYPLTAETGSFALTGYDATITYTIYSPWSNLSKHTATASNASKNNVTWSNQAKT